MDGVAGSGLEGFKGRPVVMVYGTREMKEDDKLKKMILRREQDDKSRKMIDAAVVRLFGPGDGGKTLHTPFRRLADRYPFIGQVMNDCNAVLFGAPKQNEIVKAIADELPIKFLEDGVKVGDKSYRGEGVGLVMVYPNPVSPNRYILLLPEDYAGDSPWTYPDWMVVKNVKGPGRVRQQVLAQGTFDAKWQLAK
jgi:hypothetical protein